MSTEPIATFAHDDATHQITDNVVVNRDAEGGPIMAERHEAPMSCPMFTTGDVALVERVAREERVTGDVEGLAAQYEDLAARMESLLDLGA